MNWFTADTHFYHENIIKYCDRPFQNKFEMNKVLVDNFNSVVDEDDTIYFLGDVAFTDNHQQLKKLLSSINGNKILILGNHDTHFSPWAYIEAGFQSVHTSLMLTLSDEREYILNHDPCIACNPNDKYRYLCGHVHNLFEQIDNGRVLNVGVDVRNFFPISEREIINEG